MAGSQIGGGQGFSTETLNLVLSSDFAIPTAARAGRRAQHAGMPVGRVSDTLSEARTGAGRFPDGVGNDGDGDEEGGLSRWAPGPPPAVDTADFMVETPNIGARQMVSLGFQNSTLDMSTQRVIEPPWAELGVARAALPLPRGGTFTATPLARAPPQAAPRGGDFDAPPPPPPPLLAPLTVQLPPPVLEVARAALVEAPPGGPPCVQLVLRGGALPRPAGLLQAALLQLAGEAGCDEAPLTLQGAPAAPLALGGGAPGAGVRLPSRGLRVEGTSVLRVRSAAVAAALGLSEATPAAGPAEAGGAPLAVLTAGALPPSRLAEVLTQVFEGAARRVVGRCAAREGVATPSLSVAWVPDAGALQVTNTSRSTGLVLAGDGWGAVGVPQGRPLQPTQFLTGGARGPPVHARVALAPGSPSDAGSLAAVVQAALQRGRVPTPNPGGPGCDGGACSAGTLWVTQGGQCPSAGTPVTLPPGLYTVDEAVKALAQALEAAGLPVTALRGPGGGACAPGTRHPSACAPAPGEGADNPAAAAARAVAAAARVVPPGRVALVSTTGAPFGVDLAGFTLRGTLGFTPEDTPQVTQGVLVVAPGPPREPARVEVPLLGGAPDACHLQAYPDLVRVGVAGVAPPSPDGGFDGGGASDGTPGRLQFRVLPGVQTVLPPGRTEVDPDARTLTVTASPALPLLPGDPVLLHLSTEPGAPAPPPPPPPGSGDGEAGGAGGPSPCCTLTPCSRSTVPPVIVAGVLLPPRASTPGQQTLLLSTTDADTWLTLLQWVAEEGGGGGTPPPADDEEAATDGEGDDGTAPVTPDLPPALRVAVSRAAPGTLCLATRLLQEPRVFDTQRSGFLPRGVRPSLLGLPAGWSCAASGAMRAPSVPYLVSAQQVLLIVRLNDWNGTPVGAVHVPYRSHASDETALVAMILTPGGGYDSISSDWSVSTLGQQTHTENVSRFRLTLINDDGTPFVTRGQRIVYTLSAEVGM